MTTYQFPMKNIITSQTVRFILCIIMQVLRGKCMYEGMHMHMHKKNKKLLCFYKTNKNIDGLRGKLPSKFKLNKNLYNIQKPID